MVWQIDSVTKKDMIRELSPEALSYFASIELGNDWNKYDKATSGKFVRLGEIIFLGSRINYGSVDYDGQRKNLKHWEIMRFAMSDIGPVRRAEIEDSAASMTTLKETGLMVDAGMSDIFVDNEGQPVELIFWRKSYDFGRADEAGRQRTAEIARATLGETILVTVN
jgi:hypothetical protein